VVCEYPVLSRICFVVKTTQPLSLLFRFSGCCCRTREGIKGKSGCSCEYIDWVHPVAVHMYSTPSSGRMDPHHLPQHTTYISCGGYSTINAFMKQHPDELKRYLSFLRLTCQDVIFLSALQSHFLSSSFALTKSIRFSIHLYIIAITKHCNYANCIGTYLSNCVIKLLPLVRLSLSNTRPSLHLVTN
jgi:hypothetical protein